MRDSYRHKGLRKKLIRELERKGIEDAAVLEAMMQVPRHLFLDKAFEEWAYQDVPFPIGNEQTISQPFTVAVQTVLLHVRPTMKILEIGTGSGYQACILAEMGAKVYTIERIEALYHKTRDLLEQLGYGRIRTFLKDGHEGLKRFAPFDRILVTAGATEVPEQLLQQLKPGGILVIPVGGDDQQTMLQITRESAKIFRTKKFGAFRFVPFLKGTE